jgi:hypothetical protein
MLERIRCPANSRAYNWASSAAEPVTDGVAMLVPLYEA